MLRNLDKHISLATAVLQNLSLDSLVITSESNEEKEGIFQRKVELNALELDYYRDLAGVLMEGMSLGVLSER
jgi:hypothetical protein